MVCTPGVENCKAELVLDDKDGVMAKVMKKVGMKPKGDIIISFWGKPIKFESKFSPMLRCKHLDNILDTFDSACIQVS